MQKNKIFHILSYIPYLFLISLFFPEKTNPAVRFPCCQGMLLTFVSLVFEIIFSILGFILGWSSILAIIVAIPAAIVDIAVLVLIIIGIVNAVNDKEEALPVIGKYAFYK